MLFQAVVVFLPILNFFQISCKRGKVHCDNMYSKYLLDKVVLSGVFCLIDVNASFSHCSKFCFLKKVI